MQSIHSPDDAAPQRLRCARCGLTAVAGERAWGALTSVSHSGGTAAQEKAGHAVGLDLCRRCVRATLREALGMAREVPAEPDTDPQALPASAQAERTHRALRSMDRTDAYIRASQRRLDGWRRADAAAWAGEGVMARDRDGPAASRLQPAANGGSSASASNAALASFGATTGVAGAAAEAPDSAANGQSIDSEGSSQRIARSQSRA
jgi:hypothetical protein